ncbi:MAG: diaminopimelate decarboxylase [Spirochaetaceae bacterium]|jgi:diaminopimelate decarboxylase|nr:diaminopimelate decarboxylase [Spirochaetaceae bacterium]
MSVKHFPLDRERLEALAEKYQTPFYVYDEGAIRENARAIQRAFAMLPGYKEHFAVKALPNPFILKILAEEGLGADCSSLPELLLADMAGIKGEAIMFSSNETPSAEFRKARELGAVINLDDLSHIEFLERAAGIPDLISCRYNPGPLKEGNAIIGKPEEAKFGFTREQLFDGYRLLKQKGARRFGLHTMVASNELGLEYHIETARMLFDLALEIFSRTGLRIEFVNLGGGVGIPYRPDEEGIKWEDLAGGVKKAYDEKIKGGPLDPLCIHSEYGRPITGPYGWLVSRAVHRKGIYREYIGLDSCMADLMRPALYGAYHHITIAGRENEEASKTYDVVGSLCENNDKFAVRRKLPEIRTGEKDGDLVIIHDAGAHGRAMGFNYNGKLRCGELLLRPDASVVEIRRKETAGDYFATLDLEGLKDFIL